MSQDLGETALVARAVNGDKAALEQVIGLLQDPLYRLALRIVLRTLRQLLGGVLVADG